MFNPYEAVNQGIQNFINTQLTLANLKRQQASDERELEMHRHKMKLGQYALEALKEEAEGRRALKEIAKTMPPSIIEDSVIGHAPKTHEGDLEVPDREIKEKKERPMTLGERYDRTAKELIARGHYTLGSQFADKAHQVKLQDVQIKAQEKQMMQGFFNMIQQVGGANPELAKKMIVEQGRRLGIDVNPDSINIRRNSIVVEKIDGEKFYGTPDGKWHKIPKDTKMDLLEARFEKHRRPDGSIDIDKAIKEHEAYETGKIYIGRRLDEDKERMKEIDYEIRLRQASVNAELQDIEKQTKGITPTGGSGKYRKRFPLYGRYDFEPKYQRMGKDKKMVGITDPKETENLDKLFERKKTLQRELREIPSKVKREYGRQPEIETPREIDLSKIPQGDKLPQHIKAQVKGKIGQKDETGRIIGNVYKSADGKEAAIYMGKNYWYRVSGEK